MKTPKIITADYLFMQFKTAIIPLGDVCDIYYPHLKKAEISKKSREQGFPFACFKLADSQKAPYFVHLSDLAAAIDSNYRIFKHDHLQLHS